ncbi:MAG: PaaI family thioesterase [Syntrophomonas sp.]|nr:PaaI family thioesterase [Syntrophomonas sp.]
MINDGLDEKLFNYLQKSISETGFYNLLGLDLLLLSSGYTEFKVVPGPQHKNGIGLIQGGLMISIVDAAMGNAIRTLGIVGATVDISTSFTASAKVGDAILARGKVLKAGKSLIFTEGYVYAGDKLIGHSKATFKKVSEYNL